MAWNKTSSGEEASSVTDAPVVETPKKNTKENMKKPSENLLSMFKPAIDIPTVKCLRMSIYSPAKCGKTHFCLTAKRPIYFLDTEKSANILVKQLPEEIQKEIFIVDLVEFAEKKGNHLDVVSSMEVAFDVIGQLVDAVSESESIGTIVIDSCSDLWEFLKQWLQEQTDLKTVKSTGDMMSTEWGRANKRWISFMRLLQASNWNVILTFKAKEKFGPKGERLGIFDPDWQKNTFHWLDLNVELQRIADQHKFIIHGGRFGDTYEEKSNIDFDDLRGYLTNKSGVIFE